MLQSSRYDMCANTQRLKLATCVPANYWHTSRLNWHTSRLNWHTSRHFRLAHKSLAHLSEYPEVYTEVYTEGQIKRERALENDSNIMINVEWQGDLRLLLRQPGPLMPLFCKCYNHHATTPTRQKGTVSVTTITVCCKCKYNRTNTTGINVLYSQPWYK